MLRVIRPVFEVVKEGRIFYDQHGTRLHRKATGLPGNTPEAFYPNSQKLIRQMFLVEIHLACFAEDGDYILCFEIDENRNRLNEDFLLKTGNAYKI